MVSNITPDIVDSPPSKPSPTPRLTTCRTLRRSHDAVAMYSVSIANRKQASIFDTNVPTTNGEPFTDGSSRSVARREPDADETADEHHEIHQTIGKRVESRLHAFHRRERNLRRMLGCGGTGTAHIRARHFGDVDRLCGGIRLITRVWRVCRPLFLRFHHVPLVLGFPRTASFRPSHTATSWPQVPSS